MAFYLKTETASPKAHSRHFSCQPENAYRVSRVKDPGLRFYNLGLGRWISRDPIEEGGGSLLYGFVRNHPMTSFDPDGACPRWVTSDGSGGYVEVTNENQVRIEDASIVENGLTDVLHNETFSQNCVQIDVIPRIRVRKGLKNANAVGDVVLYESHPYGQPSQKGTCLGQRRDAIVAHERGHLKAFFELRKALDSVLRLLCETSAATPEDQAELANQVQQTIDAALSQTSEAQKSTQYANEATISSHAAPAYQPTDVSYGFDYAWKKQ